MASTSECSGQKVIVMKMECSVDKSGETVANGEWEAAVGSTQRVLELQNKCELLDKDGEVIKYTGELH